MFLEKESGVYNENFSSMKAFEMGHLAKLICDLLEGINKLNDNQLVFLSSLTTTFSEYIHINDKSVRIFTQKLLKRVNNIPLLEEVNFPTAES